MTVAADRTIDNALDVGRKIPVDALSPAMLTELEGVVVEKITGPNDIGATPANVVALSRPAVSVVSIQSYVTATGAVSAVALFPIEGTHWDLTKKGPDGVALLTNPHATANFTAETWLVTYKADAPEATAGGQSIVTP